MRFEAHEVMLGADHPNWPKEIFWKVYDNVKKHYRFGMYTKEELASNVSDKLNTEYGCKQEV